MTWGCAAEVVGCVWARKPDGINAADAEQATAMKSRANLLGKKAGRQLCEFISVNVYSERNAFETFQLRESGCRPVWDFGLMPKRSGMPDLTIRQSSDSQCCVVAGSYSCESSSTSSSVSCHDLSGLYVSIAWNVLSVSGPRSF